MNKAYRLIWNIAKDAWVIAAEIVKGNGGPPPVARPLLALASVLILSSSALALPAGPQVINGTVSMNSQGNNLTITNSPNAIINWQRFSIAGGESTRFVQQNAASTVLNRIVGVDPSSIIGTLQSNGKVFLINPNGIIFGQGARVDAAGLVASSLNMTDADFLGNRYLLSAGRSAGVVRNEGSITTPAGGQVWLIAPNVENSGIITSPNGTVTLAAGQRVHLVDPDKPEIAVVVSAPDDGSVNLGSIVAQGGQIAMYGAIVGQKGNVNADSVVRGDNGSIFFKSTRGTTLAAGSTTTANGPEGGSITVRSENSDTLVSGNISAAGAEGAGGTVHILGNRVGLLDNASVDASGATGGGTVLVGGDYQGSNPDIRNAQAAYVGKDSTIRADATVNGDGGKVVVWSDGSTKVHGNLSANTDDTEGKGGLIETSGHNLDTQGIRVVTGKNGTWLLDPYDVTISAAPSAGGSFDGTAAPGPNIWAPSAPGSNILTTDLVNALSGYAGTVRVTTTGGGAEPGNITVNDPVIAPAAGAATLELLAANDIILNKPLDFTVGGNIILNASGGSISFGSLDGGATNGTINATGVTLTAPNGVINGSPYGFVTEITASNLNMTTQGGINYIKPNISQGITVNNTANNVRIYNQNTSGVSKTFTGSNGGGSITFESFDSVNTTTITSLSAPGDIILRTNKAPSVIGPVNSGSRVFLSSFDNSPVLNLSVEGSDSYNLTSFSLDNISATNGIVIGNDNFGNITPSLSIATSGALTLTGPKQIEFHGQNITTGTSGISLSGTGSGLTFLGTMSGGQISLGIGTISVPTGSVKVAPAFPSTGIFLGSAAAAGLNIPSLGNITAETVEIGVPGATSGAILIENAISTPSTSPHILNAGTGGINQLPGQTISVPSLGIRSVGPVSLMEANSVSNLAAAIGDGSNPNNNFKFTNNSALNIGSFPGLAGVFISISGGYDAGTPDGVISLSSSGALTQSADAFMAGKAVYAKGATVNLTQPNMTGVIAGEATGGSFRYTSSNSLFVTAVDGASGIQNTGIGGDIILTSTSGGIGQDAPLSTRNVTGGGGFNLSLTSSSFTGLQHAGNNVSNISADLGTGSLNFMNSADLGVGNITTNNNLIDIQVPPTNTITVNGSINTATGANSIFHLAGGGITLNAAVTNSEIIAIQSSTPTQGITLASGVLGTANTRIIDLVTDKLTLSGGTAMVGATAGNGINIAPFTAGTPIVVGTGAITGTLYITDTSTATFTSPDFGIGSLPGDPFVAASGAIAVNAPISRGSGRLGLFSSGGITQTAPITAGSLGVIAGGAVNLSTPNQVSNLAIETSTGAINIANSTALTVTSMTGGMKTPATITGLESVGGGNITVAASAGNITLAAPIITDTTSGKVTLQAPGAAIIDSNSMEVTVTANALDVSASSGIGTIAAPLRTQVTYLKAVNTMGGDISILNTGALTTDDATAISNSPGKVSITAQSPLTIGTAGVSAGSDVILTAGGPVWETGKTGDDLTVNGPITSTGGNIVLNAGNSITGSGVLTASSGTVTSNANLNPSDVVPPPTLDACIADPALTGCGTVLPTLATCTEAPATAGCAVVLPTIDTCTTTPTAEGCTVVLPTMETCTATPTAPGCTVVLPSMATCTTTPTAPGCTVVLPTLDTCTATPTAPGCTAVLPSMATCTATPTAPGCTVVLPTMDICTATPTAPGCAVVLPSLTTCTTTPAAPGCTVVLPTMDTCTATPTAPGCTAVLPSLATCATNPTAPGCSAVLPDSETVMTESTIVQEINIAVIPTEESDPAGQPNSENEEEKAKKEAKARKEAAAAQGNTGEERQQYCN